MTLANIRNISVRVTVANRVREQPERRDNFCLLCRIRGYGVRELRQETRTVLNADYSAHRVEVSYWKRSGGVCILLNEPDPLINFVRILGHELINTAADLDVVYEAKPLYEKLGTSRK